MATLSALPPIRKSHKGATLIHRAEGDLPALVRLRIGNSTDLYHVWPLKTDFGRGFHVAKVALDGDAYDVNVDGRRSTCECKGFLRWHHCKHVQGLGALVRAGKL